MDHLSYSIRRLLNKNREGKHKDFDGPVIRMSDLNTSNTSMKNPRCSTMKKEKTKTPKSQENDNDLQQRNDKGISNSRHTDILPANKDESNPRHTEYLRSNKEDFSKCTEFPANRKRHDIQLINYDLRKIPTNLNSKEIIPDDFTLRGREKLTKTLNEIDLLKFVEDLSLENTEFQECSKQKFADVKQNLEEYFNMELESFQYLFGGNDDELQPDAARDELQVDNLLSSTRKMGEEDEDINNKRTKQKNSEIQDCTVWHTTNYNVYNGTLDNEKYYSRNLNDIECHGDHSKNEEFYNKHLKQEEYYGKHFKNKEIYYNHSDNEDCYGKHFKKKEKACQGEHSKNEECHNNHLQGVKSCNKDLKQDDEQSKNEECHSKNEAIYANWSPISKQFHKTTNNAIGNIFNVQRLLTSAEKSVEEKVYEVEIEKEIINVEAPNKSYENFKIQCDPEIRNNSIKYSTSNQESSINSDGLRSLVMFDYEHLNVIPGCASEEFHEYKHFPLSENKSLTLKRSSRKEIITFDSHPNVNSEKMRVVRMKIVGPKGGKIRIDNMNNDLATVLNDKMDVPTISDILDDEEKEFRDCRLVLDKDESTPCNEMAGYRLIDGEDKKIEYKKIKDSTSLIDKEECTPLTEINRCRLVENNTKIQRENIKDRASAVYQKLRPSKKIRDCSPTEKTNQEPSKNIEICSTGNKENNDCIKKEDQQEKKNEECRDHEDSLKIIHHASIVEENVEEAHSSLLNISGDCKEAKHIVAVVENRAEPLTTTNRYANEEFPQIEVNSININNNEAAKMKENYFIMRNNDRMINGLKEGVFFVQDETDKKNKLTVNNEEKKHEDIQAVVVNVKHDEMKISYENDHEQVYSKTAQEEHLESIETDYISTTPVNEQQSTVIKVNESKSSAANLQLETEEAFKSSQEKSKERKSDALIHESSHRRPAKMAEVLLKEDDYFSGLLASLASERDANIRSMIASEIKDCLRNKMLDSAQTEYLENPCKSNTKKEENTYLETRQPSADRISKEEMSTNMSQKDQLSSNRLSREACLKSSERLHILSKEECLKAQNINCHQSNRLSNEENDFQFKNPDQSSTNRSSKNEKFSKDTNREQSSANGLPKEETHLQTSQNINHNQSCVKGLLKEETSLKTSKNEKREKPFQNRIPGEETCTNADLNENSRESFAKTLSKPEISSNVNREELITKRSSKEENCLNKLKIINNQLNKMSKNRFDDTQLEKRTYQEFLNRQNSRYYNELAKRGNKNNLTNSGKSNKDAKYSRCRRSFMQEDFSRLTSGSQEFDMEEEKIRKLINRSSNYRPLMGTNALLSKSRMEKSDSEIVQELVMQRFSNLLDYYYQRSFHRQSSRQHRCEDSDESVGNFQNFHEDALKVTRSSTPTTRESGEFIRFSMPVDEELRKLATPRGSEACGCQGFKGCFGLKLRTVNKCCCAVDRMNEEHQERANEEGAIHLHQRNCEPSELSQNYFKYSEEQASMSMIRNKEHVNVEKSRIQNLRKQNLRPKSLEYPNVSNDANLNRHSEMLETNFDVGYASFGTQRKQTKQSTPSNNVVKKKTNLNATNLQRNFAENNDKRRQFFENPEPINYSEFHRRPENANSNLNSLIEHFERSETNNRETSALRLIQSDSLRKKITDIHDCSNNKSSPKAGLLETDLDHELAQSNSGAKPFFLHNPGSLIDCSRKPRETDLDQFSLPRQLKRETLKPAKTHSEENLKSQSTDKDAIDFEPSFQSTIARSSRKSSTVEMTSSKNSLNNGSRNSLNDGKSRKFLTVKVTEINGSIDSMQGFSGKKTSEREGNFLDREDNLKTMSNSTLTITDSLELDLNLDFLKSTDEHNLETSSEILEKKMEEENLYDSSDRVSYDAQKFLTDALGDELKAYLSTDSQLISDLDLSENPSIGTSNISDLLSKASSYGVVQQDRPIRRTSTIYEENNYSQNEYADYISNDKKLADLILETNVQNQILAQTHKALTLCRRTKEFMASIEEIEAERILLIATLKREALKEEIQRMEYEELSDSPYKNTGCVRIKGITFPPKPRNSYMPNMFDKRRKEFTHWFVSVLKSGATVFATKPVIADNDGMVKFDDEFIFDNLSPDFSIVVGVYVIKIKNNARNYSHESKFHLNKDVKTLCPSPSKLFHMSRDPKNKIPEDTSPSSFTLGGRCVIGINNLKDLGYFKLTDMPLAPQLEGTAVINFITSVTMKEEFSDFLNVGAETGEFITWNRRWCSLRGAHLFYYNYPEDEEPAGKLDLSYCISSYITTAERTMCARPRTLFLETALKSSSEHSPKIARHFLAADSMSQMKVWETKLNHTVAALRNWNCMKCNFVFSKV